MWAQERLEYLLKRTLRWASLEHSRKCLRYRSKHSEVEVVAIRPLEVAIRPMQMLTGSTAPATRREEAPTITRTHIPIVSSKLQGTQIPLEKINLSCWNFPDGHLPDRLTRFSQSPPRMAKLSSWVSCGDAAASEGVHLEDHSHTWLRGAVWWRRRRVVNNVALAKVRPDTWLMQPQPTAAL
jgi:hypothetical protein